MDSIDRSKLVPHEILISVYRLAENRHPERFNKSNRQAFIQQETKTPLRSSGIKVHPYNIDTQKKLADFIFHTWKSGYFIVRFWSHKKNIFHGSFVGRARIKIRPKKIAVTYENNGKVWQVLEDSEDHCEFEWIKTMPKTKKNPTGCADRMYFFFWWRGAGSENEDVYKASEEID